VTRVAMGRRPLLAMALGWLAVVLAVAAVTFVVVDRAGRGVGRASAAEALAVPASRMPGTTRPAPTASTGPRPSADAPSPGGPATSSTPKPPTTGPTSGPASPSPEVAVRTASFSTDGGTVVASCKGSQLSLVSIRPRDGWRFKQDSENGGLEVTFKAEERDVEMLLVCVRGTPTRAPSRAGEERAD